MRGSGGESLSAWPLSQPFLQFPIALGLVTMSSVGFQSWMFGDLISQVQVLKVGVPSVGFKSFTPQREALGGRFLTVFFSFFPKEHFPHVALDSGVYRGR